MDDETPALFDMPASGGAPHDFEAATSNPVDDDWDAPEPAHYDDVDENPDLHTGLVVHRFSSAEVAERHDREFVQPVRRLNATLNEVLDVDANPDRAPEEALALLKTAMDTFQDESATWLD